MKRNKEDIQFRSFDWPLSRERINWGQRINSNGREFYFRSNGVQCVGTFTKSDLIRLAYELLKAANNA